MKIIHRIWYFSFWIWVRLGLSFYYRKIRLSGVENIPKGVPVIFGANHENALIDPLIQTTRFPWMIHYLVRADVFKKPAVKWFLNSLNLMPVYRMSDGVNSVKANDEIFKNCFEVFKKGEHLILYPEGSHDHRRIERRSKKGIARIALGAVNQPDAPDELYIVPVGMNYSAHKTFRSAVHLCFGKAIKVEKVPENKESTQQLLKDFDEGLKQCHVSLHKEKFDVLDQVIFHNQKPGALIDVKNTNALAENVRQALTPQDEEEIRLLSRKLEQGGIQFPFVRSRHTWLNGLLMVVLAPLMLFGLVVHSPALLAGYYIMKGIKDKVFTDTMYFGVGLVLVPLMWLLVGVVTWFIFHSLWLSIGLVIASGISLVLYGVFRRQWAIFKSNRLLHRKGLTKTYENLMSLIDKIKASAQKQTAASH